MLTFEFEAQQRLSGCLREIILLEHERLSDQNKIANSKRK